MKRKGNLISLFVFFMVVGSQASAAPRIFTCPAVEAGNYGRSSYIDSHTGLKWNLVWKQAAKPIWNQISIPQMAICGSKQVRGVPMTYQCVTFQCQSPAAIALLASRAVKCYSVYTSTDKTFYCEGATS